MPCPAVQQPHLLFEPIQGLPALVGPPVQDLHATVTRLALLCISGIYSRHWDLLMRPAVCSGDSALYEQLLRNTYSISGCKGNVQLINGWRSVQWLQGSVHAGSVLFAAAAIQHTYAGSCCVTCMHVGYYYYYYWGTTQHAGSC